MVAMALAESAQVLPAQIGADDGVGVSGVAPPGNATPTQGESAKPVAPKPKRSPVQYLWAALIARVYEVFPLLCPKSGGQMRLAHLLSVITT